MKYLMMMILFPIVAYTQITAKTASFQFNVHVDLTTGKYSSTAVATSMVKQMEHLCSTSPVKKDLFINTYYVPTLGICPSPSGAIGSERPFYRFKKELKVLKLDGVLKLDDTTLFSKVDTNQNDPDGSSCVLPYFVWEHESDEIIIVVTTSDDKYALVILTPTYKTVDCYATVDNPSTGEHTSHHWTIADISGFNAAWYIQANGHPLFRGIDISTGVIRNPYRSYTKTVFRGMGCYSILGRKVPMEQVRRKAMHRITPSLYVVEDRGGLRLMLK